MEILRPLANLGKELTIEAGKGLYYEVIAPELALTPQQQEAAQMRSRFNQQDLIALLQIEMEEELLQAHMQYPGRMVSHLLDIDPQLQTDGTALANVRSQLSLEANGSLQQAIGGQSNYDMPEISYIPATVSSMDAAAL